MSIIDLFLGFAINLLITVTIVRGIYYPVKQDKNYVFTYIAFNTVIYFAMTFLASAELSVGVGFGLFAIFSVLRYRTSTISPREMTYLFVVIALPVMNSVLMRADAWMMLTAVNASVAAVLFVLEREWGFHYEFAQSVRYERMELIKPEKHDLLLADLRKRTGLPIKRVEIGRINFSNATAEMMIYYDKPQARAWSSEREVGYVDERD
ncbi:MAG: DUF4956 domain-containing protein [Caldilineaceae bacterium]|nr:DUF4956 domain-containing protein [Caldilineaceae bacterium]